MSIEKDILHSVETYIYYIYIIYIYYKYIYIYIYIHTQRERVKQDRVMSTTSFLVEI